MKRTSQVLAIALALAALGGCGGGGSSSRHNADVEAIKKDVTPETKFSMDSEGKSVSGGDIAVPDAAPGKK